MKKAKKSNGGNNSVSHVSKGSVLYDLGLGDDEIQSLKIKARLHSQILKIIESKKLTSRNLEKLLDQPQPRISELLNGKISKTSIEKLVDYLDRLGEEAIINFRSKKEAA